MSSPSRKASLLLPSPPTSLQVQVPIEQLESSVEENSVEPLPAPPISSSSIHGRYAVVKPRISSATSSGPTSTSDGEEQIPKEDAVCRFCFEELSQGDALKVKCRCSSTLIHEECATKWSQQRENNICVHCKQELQEVPVTLLPGPVSTPTLPGPVSAPADNKVSKRIRFPAIFKNK